MNCIKAGCMLWSLWSQKLPTLVTIGDAVASFLDNPDELTRGRCLMERRDISKGTLQWSKKEDSGPPFTGPITYVLPKTYEGDTFRAWASTASSKRWAATVFILLANMIVASSLLAQGVENLKMYLFGASAFKMGISSIT